MAVRAVRHVLGSGRHEDRRRRRPGWPRRIRPVHIPVSGRRHGTDRWHQPEPRLGRRNLVSSIGRDMDASGYDDERHTGRRALAPRQPFRAMDSTAMIGGDHANNNSGGVWAFALSADQPTAPTDVVAAAADGEATVSFTPPSSDGGATVTSYTVTASPGGQTITGPASPITVPGLSDGTSYTFTVAATNSAGTGPALGGVEPCHSDRLEQRRRWRINPRPRRHGQRSDDDRDRRPGDVLVRSLRSERSRRKRHSPDRDAPAGHRCRLDLHRPRRGLCRREPARSTAAWTSSPGRWSRTSRSF